jgi:hypothetical protein
MSTLHDEFLAKLKEIAELTRRVDGEDRDKIFEMIEKHIGEIKELYNQKNGHWATETVDLIILGCVLLLLENKDVGEVFEKRLPKYEAKLRGLTKK